jgi:GNAT superfamily N-acetyltransferase
MVSAPEPLTEKHDLASFDCENPSLDNWLRQKALPNQASGASKTYVIREGHNVVIGYYCLSTGAVRREEATSKVKSNMPEPVPMMLLGRLAIDKNHKGHGLGRALLRDAIQRVLQASSIVGVRGIFVHALPEAERFHEKAGFHMSPLPRVKDQPALMMIFLKEAIAAIS